MRKFNAFHHRLPEENTSAEDKEQPRRFNAYRTIVSKHEAMKSRLKDEPVAVIDTDN